MVTQTDIAAAAGVSRAAVSLALSGSPRVSEPTRARIKKAAEQLGYVRDLSAATLASASSPFVGIVLPDLQNPIYENFVRAIQEPADRAGLMPLIVTANNSTEREQLIIQRLMELHVKGIIVFSPASSADTLKEFGPKTKLVVHGLSHIGNGVDTLSVDEPKGAEKIVSHMKRRGWEKLVYAVVPARQGDKGPVFREEALRLAAKEHGLEFQLLEITEGVNNTLEALHKELRDEKVAYVSHNDLLGSEILSTLRGLGVDVGYDTALISYDDTYFSSALNGNFTSLGQNIKRQAEIAIELLADYDPAEKKPTSSQDAVMVPHLVVRASS